MPVFYLASATWCYSGNAVRCYATFCRWKEDCHLEKKIHLWTSVHTDLFNLSMKLDLQTLCSNDRASMISK